MISGVVWLLQSSIRKGREQQFNILKDIVSLVDRIKVAETAEDVDKIADHRDEIGCHALYLASTGQLRNSKLTAIMIGLMTARNAADHWHKQRQHDEG